MPRALMGEAERRAVRMGHRIVWNTIGDHVANGRCASCGITISVATTNDGFTEIVGAAQREPCGELPPGARP